MNRWKFNKRGFSLTQIMISVIMIVAIALLGIQLYEIYERKQAEKAVIEILQGSERKLNAKEIRNFNAIVEANCGTIQTLIMVELAGSDSETVKDSINNIFRDSSIKNPHTGLAQIQNGYPGDKGCVVVTYDNDTEIFYINGNGSNNETILEKPLTVRR